MEVDDGDRSVANRVACVCLCCCYFLGCQSAPAEYELIEVRNVKHYPVLRKASSLRGWSSLGDCGVRYNDRRMGQSEATMAFMGRN